MSVDGVVLVHGSNLSASCWDQVLEHLTTPAVAADLPGRGSRPADITAVTLDDCVQSVIDSADRAALNRFVLVGHSLGAVTITEIASRFPERVAELVYVGGLVPGSGSSAAAVLFGDDLPAGEPRTTTEERARMFFANDMTDEQWVGVWDGFVPESAGVWNSRLTGYPSCIPITYVSMTDDVGVPPALAKQMIANLGADVDHRVLSAGHIVMVIKPRELAAIINDVVGRA
jgi:pimeloyl-ACP methyl ester carboxylesterase